MRSPAKIPARQPTVLYRAALLLVTAAMLLLPLLYVALIAALGFGVYEFAIHDFRQIWDWPVGNSRYGVFVKILCSCTPLLAGAAALVFLIKPLFARRSARMQPLALHPEFEPRVYTLARDVCALLSAPSPVRIEVNCDVNASARFERGLRSFFSNRLVLTLGMPLVAGLSQRELAGVIAHEFGHFRQSGGMRLSYLIRRVNGWFARVIYDRDAWDEAVESASASAEGGLSLMAALVRAGIWLSRRVLWLLMMLGHAISALLLRQMEYDADDAEVRVAGSAAFESTTLKLALLGSVQSEIQREMVRSWRKSLQLPDNLPVLLEHHVARLPAIRREKIENEAVLGKTRWLDTHPGAADRVRTARRIADPGLAFPDEPARELFEDFNAVSRLVTLAHYEDDLNVPTSPDFLIPLEQMLGVVNNPTPAAPTAPASLPFKMMGYDPAAFQRPPQPPGSAS